MSTSTRILLLLFFSFAVIVVGVASESSTAHAATFNVTKTADTNDGTCDADCSLREAIIAANNTSGPDTITFTDLGVGSMYTLTIAGTGEEQAATGDLDIRDEITIIGNGQASTIIQAGTNSTNGIDRVFDMVSPASASVSVKATFEDLTIQNGHPTSASLPFLFAVGGNISARAGNGRFDLILERVTVANGSTTGASGAGIHIATPFNQANSTLKIDDSTISGNISDFGGGGIDCLNCTLNITGTNIMNNWANTNSSGFGGGGIQAIGDNKSVTITDTDIMGNRTNDSGGGILLGGNSVTNITGSTIALNNATVSGSGIATESTLAGGTINVSLSRFVTNFTTAIANNAGTVNAENNWWGCDGFPTNGLCSTISGAVDFDPRIDMQFTAVPNSVVLGGNATLTADFTQNTDGATISPDALNGNLVLFTGAPLGTATPSATTITNGMATSTFTGTSVGSGNVSVNFDNASLTAPMTVTSPPEADLSISKTDSADPIVAGNTLTYTITVNNAGPDEAQNVVVTDTFPAGVTLVSTTGCAEDPNGVPTCSIGNIASGGSAQYTIEVTVDAGTIGTITNLASVASDTGDPDTGNNGASEDTVVNAPSADLSITKTDSADPIFAGDTLTYTIEVSNAGPQTAEDVIVTDTLPAGVTLVSTSGCAEDPNGVPTCNLGDIASGGSAQFTIEVTADSSTAGTITNVATVSSDTGDPNTGNNSVSEDTLVNALTADLSISKSDSVDPVAASSTLMYVIRVDNNGPANAHDVVVTDTLPAEATLVSTSGCAEDPNGVPTCSLGTINAGGFAEYTITVFIDGGIATSTQIVNEASVTSSTTEGNPGDESITEETTVMALADISVTSSDLPDPVAVGEQLTYSFVVTNNGPAQARGVRLVDLLDPSMGFIVESATATQGRCRDMGATVECRFGTLNSGNSIDVEIVVTPTQKGKHRNRARVGSDAPDPDHTNNFAGERTTVVEQPS